MLITFCTGEDDSEFDGDPFGLYSETEEPQTEVCQTQESQTEVCQTQESQTEV